MKALRRAGASSIAAANIVLADYLPQHNARFAVAAADPADAHRRLPRGLDLDGVCSMHYTRKVANDNTVRLEERLVQIPPGPRRRSYACCHVDVQERIDGALVVVYQGAVIARQARQSDAPVRARTRTRGRELPADPKPPRRAAEPVSDVDLPPDLFAPLWTEHPWRRAAALASTDKKNGRQRQRAEARLPFSSKQTIILGPGDK